MTTFTVALVGADGAGKTTIARMLLARFPLPMKRIYMGVAMQSANVLLPTSRLIQYLKHRRDHAKARQMGAAAPATMDADFRQTISPPRGGLRAPLQTLHRIAEEWYRQWVAWRYQRRGYIVLCDRHFLFEYNPASVARAAYAKFPLSYRFHLWLLERFFPRPDLVIFLDAPPEILFGRKPERTLEHLQRYREDLIRQGRTVRNFNRVDVARSPDTVLAEITNLIMRFRDSGAA